jgi:hypothetical protein
VKVKETNIVEVAKLPFDNMFGSGETMVESFESNETLTQAGVARRSRPVVKETGRKENGVRMATQSQNAVVWELLVQFWGAIWVLVGRCFGRR